MTEILIQNEITVMNHKLHVLPRISKNSRIFESSVNEEGGPESPITEFQHHSIDQVQSHMPELIITSITSRLNKTF